MKLALSFQTLYQRIQQLTESSTLISVNANFHAIIANVDQFKL